MIEIPEVETGAPKSNRPDFRLVGMLQDRYVILESSDGLVLFDPKAAWERILFERMAKERKAGMEAQNLLVPILMELDPRDLDLLLREKMALLEAGLEIESFGGNTLQIRSVPGCVEIDEPKALLDDILEEMLHGPVSAGKFAFERLARIIFEQGSESSEPKTLRSQRPA